MLVAGMMMVIGVGAASTHVLSAESRHESDDHDQRLIESSTCPDRRDDEPRIATNVVSFGGGKQTMAVSVPRTVLLRVDSSGQVTAAATNTGCAPRKLEDVFVFRLDGTVSPDTDFDVDACAWTGDFSVPGQFQDQSCPADAASNERRRVAPQGCATSRCASDG
jgi:hypothetical protein